MPQTNIVSCIRTVTRKTGGSGAVAEPDHSSLEPQLGALYTWRLVRTPAENRLKVDQGFRIYKTAFESGLKLRANDIVESQKTKAGVYRLIRSRRGEKSLFTYRARIESVVDGDTLRVEIDIGFGNVTRQYLRLRGINTPEMDTSEGVAAKTAVERILKDVSFIFFTSSHADKYGRFLADVFIPGKKFLREWAKGTAILNPANDLIFLNNELLYRHLAVRMPE
jgi:endonuclease YncB( thermonuclease family)